MASRRGLLSLAGALFVVGAGAAPVMLGAAPTTTETGTSFSDATSSNVPMKVPKSPPPATKDNKDNNNNNDDDNNNNKKEKVFVPPQPRFEHFLLEPRLDPSVFGTPATAKIMRYGYPSSENIKIRAGYVTSYNRATKVPNWVAEHLNKAILSERNVTRLKARFLEDESEIESFRAKLNDYYRSGYDRGHMRPASNARGSGELMEETFFLTNIAPQTGAGFNRDYWARLEEFVRELARAHDEVWCITGPLYLPKRAENGKWYVNYEVIGSPPNVAVPTHFFKVILTEDRVPRGRPKYSLGAFVMPNSPIPADADLMDYAVPAHYVERVSGLTFFPKLPAASRAETAPLCAVKCDLPPPDFWKKRKRAAREKEHKAALEAGTPETDDTSDDGDA